jgi:nucleotide-binding universal stress UspA family protein
LGIDMSNNSIPSLASAAEDFRAARRKAALEQVLARLQSKSPILLSYEDVREKLHAVESGGQTLKEIPLDSIVGSVGRYSDFTRSFLPRTDSDLDRWARIKSATEGLTGLPPIEVYQIGETYFVKDGNHRVSVAHQMDAKSIQAYVTKVKTAVPLEPDVQPDQLIIKAEYADFLVNTDFRNVRPHADLVLTAPGQYPKLEAHMHAHKDFLENEQKREIHFHEAAGDWYDHCYIPVVNEIRERGLLRDFPDRTETDLYLWVSEHTADLQERLGQDISPGVAAEHLASRYSSRPGRIFKRVKEQLIDVLTPDELESGPAPGTWRRQRLDFRPTSALFPQVLVALSGEHEAWHALDQALVIANQEGSKIQGLYVVPGADEIVSEETIQIHEQFNRKLGAAGIMGVLHVEAGRIARRICERAQWTDLIVLNIAHPPSPEPIGRLSSGLRTLLRRCNRPVLAVPQRVTSLGPALLAFDGSPKSREALYVATYLVEQWRTPLTVLTIDDEALDAKAVQEDARSYLDSHEAGADFRIDTGDTTEAILKAAEQRSVDWLLLGGYSASPVVEVVVGSTVESLLRRCDLPMLICR